MSNLPSPHAVIELRESLAHLHLESSTEAGQVHSLLAQLDDYILPRLQAMDAPLLGVVGGSTGSGKSTIVNSLLREEISPSGVIRPTTRQPVLVMNPADAGWFSSMRVLPGLARVRGTLQLGDAATGATDATNATGATDATSLRLVETSALPAGLALIDAPDFDSIDDGNRALASQLLAAADLWIFVTTPSRYADQLVWNFLHDAAERSIEVILVLNRVEEGALGSVTADLKRMLSEAGLHSASLYVIGDAGHLSGLLPPAAVNPLNAHIKDLAADAAARREMAAKTVSGALAHAATRVQQLVDAKAREEEFSSQVEGALDEVYHSARSHVIEATSDGNLLRREVLQRWQDFVGTSDAFRTIERWYSRAVDRIGSFFSGQPAPLREVETEIEAGLHAVVVDAAESGAARAWAQLGTLAPQVREHAPSELSRASANIEEEVALMIRQWQAGLVESIHNTAGNKRKRARLMSLGLNVVTVALMLVVFASTAGLSGGELAIAGGSAVVGQKLLETIFGEDAVRRMVSQARNDLDQRIAELFRKERARYDELTAVFTTGTSAQQLSAALTSL